jgi:hypothetical protein
MPNPSVRDVHVDAVMSGLSIAYKNENYIGEQIFPRISVTNKSNVYFIYDKSSFFRNEVQQRAPGTEAAQMDYAVSTCSYLCLDWAISHVVPDEVRNNSDSPLAPDAEASEIVTDSLLRAQEIRIASKTTGASGLWGYSTSPTTKWSSDTSNPLGDIETAVNGVVSSIGRMPNVMVMSWDVWRYLKNHPDLLDRIKYTRPGSQARPGDLSDWFGIDKVLVGTQLYDTSKEGQTPSQSYIWGNSVWMGYVPNAPSLRTPAAGYLLEWQTRQIRRYRLDTKHADMFEATHSTAEIISASDAGAIVYAAI